MISRIISTPVYSKLYNSVAKNDANTGDSITFTSKTNNIDSLVNNAFRDISKTRKNNKLGLIAGTLGKTNYSIRETKFGKQAELDIIRNNEHASFDIFRLNNSPIKITEAQDRNNSPELVKIIQRFISKK